jgi:hypothetical protein
MKLRCIDPLCWIHIIDVATKEEPAWNRLRCPWCQGKLVPAIPSAGGN